MKKQVRDRENLQNTYFGKECVYCIYKEPLQYNHKNNPVKTWTKDLNGSFTKNYI